MYDVGFLLGIFLAFACFGAAAWYLFAFLDASTHGLEKLVPADWSTPSQVDGQSKSAAPPDPRTLQRMVDVTSLAINVQSIMNKMALLSCGVFSGMAFGFLGFALFLVGARGSVNMSAESKGSRFQATQLAPGLFVIICASIIISLSVTQKLNVSYTAGDATPEGDEESAVDAKAFADPDVRNNPPGL